MYYKIIGIISLIVLLIVLILLLILSRRRKIKHRYSKFKKIETDKAEMYIIDNYLSEEECDKICNLIDEYAKPSTVVGGDTGYTLSESRTSYSASLYEDNNPFIQELNKKFHETFKINKENGEVIQGQRYDKGQEFKLHHDYFEREDDPIHCKTLGQRTYTLMIYLNEPIKGGATKFEKLGLTFNPKKGRALIWNNLLDNGKGNVNTLHCGEPVLEGTKYIITKWFRKNK